jgi:hypothetical protein
VGRGGLLVYGCDHPDLAESFECSDQRRNASSEDPVIIGYKYAHLQSRYRGETAYAGRRASV